MFHKISRINNPSQITFTILPLGLIIMGDSILYVILPSNYDFFEIDRFKHDFNNVEQITKEDDTIHGIFGDHTIRKEVKPPTIDYNLVLGEELSQNIVNNYPWFYNYFKY